MSQDIRDFVTPSCRLFALGEPTHREPAFASLRNELFGQLVERGFRSIALETDRVAALTVNDYVQGIAGTLDTAMSDGFSHRFGFIDANRELVAWMHEYNRGRPPEERLTFHGFDASTEMDSAPSPRSYLEYAREYLGLDWDFATLVGDDLQWSRTEAVMDPAMSVGATAEAESLRSIADDMLLSLYARAPELIAATSRAEWFRAKTYLTAGLGLLRYHKQCAQHIEPSARMLRMSGCRDALMAQNLFDIRGVEDRRGGTLVFAHNLHLQRCSSSWQLEERELDWFGAGSIVASLLGDEYAFVAGSVGSSVALGLRAPESDTYEGVLQRRGTTWGLTPSAVVGSATTRTDTTPLQGYFPLDQRILDAADAVLHLHAGTGLMPEESGLRMPE